MSDIPFLPAAEAEFLEAVAVYEAARPGLGGEFLAEVERAARRIAFFPLHGSPYLAGTRRIVLRRFPYNVVYWPDPDDLLVVAVAHQHRRPGYWDSRVIERGSRLPEKSTMEIPSAGALLRFASSVEGERLATLSGRAQFTVRVLPTGIEVTPVSSGKPRLIPTAMIGRVCDVYLHSRSLKPGDYQDITFDASYLLALIELYSRRSRGP